MMQVYDLCLIVNRRERADIRNRYRAYRRLHWCREKARYTSIHPYVLRMYDDSWDDKSGSTT